MHPGRSKTAAWAQDSPVALSTEPAVVAVRHVVPEVARKKKRGDSRYEDSPRVPKLGQDVYSLVRGVGAAPDADHVRWDESSDGYQRPILFLGILWV